MIKLIIFDLDGVLIDSKDMHFECLNKAIEECDPAFTISYSDHISNFDGLPTSRKLEKLIERGLSRHFVSHIKNRKQELTVEYLKNNVSFDYKLIDIFSTLKANGYVVHIASNAVRETIHIILQNKGISQFVDYVASNEDVKKPKPHPEIYMRCMLEAGYGPLETLIVEDSYVGRQGVFNSGAHLCPVRNPDDVTMNKLSTWLRVIKPTAPRWKDEKMNILIPMAGAGSRFAKAGYTFPKPLIEVETKPMIQVVVDNLNIDGHYIFVVQKAHYEQYQLKCVLNMIAPGCDIVQTDGITEGAACTTLLAKEFINNDSQLLIANSDQWLEWDSNDFMYSMQGENIDGGVLTFISPPHPKWSYAKVDDLGNVTDVQEKKPISEYATTGIYYWKRGNDYVKYAEQMISNNTRVNNEFYVAPVYNEAIADKKLIKNYVVSKMMGIGTPEDLDLFLSSRRDNELK